MKFNRYTRMKMHNQSLKFVHGMISVILLGAACMEDDPDLRPLWCIMFTIAALLTIFVSFNPRYIETIFIKSLLSVYCGCSWGLLCWLLINLLTDVVKFKSTVDMADPQSEGKLPPYIINQGRKSIMLLGIVLWLKFLRMSSSNTLQSRGEDFRMDETSSLKMLKMLFLFLVPSCISFTFFFQLILNK